MKPLVALGFDFGTQSIGIAIGQTLTKTAQALSAIKVSSSNQHWKMIQQMIENWKPDVLVVGRPLHMSGKEENTTLLARTFAQELQQRFQLPVYEVDERLTTIEARAKIFENKGYKGLKKGSVDAYAAKLILESWLSHFS